MIRSVVGGGARFGAIHSQMPVSWLTGIPGLKIVAPSTPADAKGLLKAAIRDDNPVIFFEHKRLYSMSRTRPAERAVAARAGRGRARGRRRHARQRDEGRRTTASAAADLLAEQGVSAEVIDLRTLRPLDVETILRVGRRRRTASPSSRRGRSPAAGRARCSRSSPSTASATSTTPGGSRHAELADPVQPTTRGRVPTGARADRR